MRKDRALWVSLGVLLLAAAAYFLRQTGAPGFPAACVFRAITTLDCPGCGMTRATHATLNGDLAMAFRYNPLGMILLPAAAAGFGLEILGWVRDKPQSIRFRPGKKTILALAWLIAAYWILRNIPVWPLTLLAPP
jgi:hypothetical protein